MLRAGEKKVTLTVNSNPVPFFMKVGEAGEAFFVVETEEDVPEELLTSPLLGATEVSLVSKQELGRRRRCGTRAIERGVGRCGGGFSVLRELFR